jgi:predicted Ser/Thr protein kinase
MKQSSMGRRLSSLMPSFMETKNEKFLRHVEVGDLDLVETLLEKGANVNTQGPDKYYGHAIRTAVDNTDTKMLKLLLEYEGHAEAKGIDGTPNYPIRQAAYNGDIKTIDLLLLHGADIRAPDKYGDKDYPIKQSLKYKDKKLLIYLLKNYDYDYEDDETNEDMKKLGKMIFDSDMFTSNELRDILKKSEDGMFKFLFNLVYHPKLETDAIASVEKNYIIGNVLGKGSFGTVYEGEDKTTGAKVAIKIQKAKEKYILMELDILERISKDCHEYFLCIYDVIKEKDGDIQIIIMELVDGVDMTAVIKDKEFTNSERDRIMNLLEISIEKLHDLGVAHKDIKPDNIMVTKDGKVKLVDYGLSCLDMSCSWGGTQKYMHPYMIKHKGNLTREFWMSSDWYSLYVIGEKIGMDFKFLKRIQDKYESLEKINLREDMMNLF